MGQDDLPPSGDDPVVSASGLFANYLASCEAGKSIDFDALCAGHPELANELRSLERDLKHVGPVLERLGFTGAATRLIEQEVETAAPDDSAPGQDADTLPALLQRLHRRNANFERYRVESRVDVGGQGEVLRVWDSDLCRSLAMKVILDRGGGAARGTSPVDHARLGRFLEEARVAGQLDHPGVLPVHELGVDSRGRVYFTMKLVGGRTLQDVFEIVHRGDEEWTLTRALGVLLKVCEAMAYAHSRGVVHRDLKPSNVMVGEFGEVYVVDWGLARVEPRENESRAVEGLAEGTAFGTPCYMPPEQAAGRVEDVGRRSDVYSVGAILYELLGGRMPYWDPGERPSGLEVVARVREGPPAPLSEFAPYVSPELVAITEHAMARDASRRYADMGELAADLRAYLENRVVRAHRTGPLTELTKWVQRNKGWASAAALFMIVAIAAPLWAARVEASKRHEVLLTGDPQRFQSLVLEADSLWPPHPEQVGRYLSWIDEMEELLGRFDVHRTRLRNMEGEGTQGPTRDRQDTLVTGLAALGQPASVLMSVRERLRFAQGIEERSLSGEYAREAWNTAIASIADPAHCPLYEGLRIAPQLGLLPIGQDAESGLWEFAHLRSGAVPERDPETGVLRVTSESGLVLVLIPGGPFWMGMQAEDPALPNYDDAPQFDADPSLEVEDLDPFFVSKYEMTQAQWMRFEGENPSYLSSEHPVFGESFTMLHPVEGVAWDACERVLWRLGLRLPTEAQWESAARAGSTERWWTGDDPALLRGAANLADLSFAVQGGDVSRGPFSWPEFDDGYPGHAPVDTLRPNRFGLHHVAGNVYEWCADDWTLLRDPVIGRASDGLRTREAPGPPARVYRGGCFRSDLLEARSGWRSGEPPRNSSMALGVRPARRMDGE